MTRAQCGNRRRHHDVGKISFPMSPTRTIVTFLCAVLLGLAGAPHVQGQDAARAAALLEEARRTLGGEERLRAVTTLDVRGPFKRLAGQTTIEGELQVRIALPDKLRRDEDMSPPGGGPAIVRTEVLNGTEVWEENTGRGGLFLGRFGPGAGGRGAAPDGRGAAVDPAEFEAARRRALQAELGRFILAWLLAVDDQVAWIGVAEAPDGKADVLEVTPATGPVIRLFLDQASRMPLMMTWQGAAPQIFVAGRRGGSGAEAAPTPPPSTRQATFRLTLGDYKPVNGIRLPHFITRGVDDRTLEEWTIDSYRINPSLRGNVFTK